MCMLVSRMLHLPPPSSPPPTLTHFTALSTLAPSALPTILHPEVAYLLHAIWGVNTELFATPPFLSPHYTHHYTSLPFLTYDTMHPPPTSLPGPAAGITQAANPDLPPFVRSLSADRPPCFLLVLGPFPASLQAEVRANPPTARARLPPLTLPIPHRELLLGEHEPTRSGSAVYQQHVEILNYGEARDLHALIRRLPINSHALMQGWKPSCGPLSSPSPDATLTTATRLGRCLSWFPTPPRAGTAPPNSPGDLPDPLITIGSTLHALPPSLAARGAPPQLAPLLKYMHIPAVDRPLVARRLHQQWITELAAIHCRFRTITSSYESLHDIRPLARTHPTPPPESPAVDNSALDIFRDHPVFLALPPPRRRAQQTAFSGPNINYEPLPPASPRRQFGPTPAGVFAKMPVTLPGPAPSTAAITSLQPDSPGPPVPPAGAAAPAPH